MFTEARRLFKTPDVTPASECDLKWEKPDEEALVAYMCAEKGFGEDRIRNGCKKLLKGRGGATQGRLDSFFKVSLLFSCFLLNLIDAGVGLPYPRAEQAQGRR